MFYMFVGLHYSIADSKIHGANMGPIWGRQDPGGPHLGPMNLGIWDVVLYICDTSIYFHMRHFSATYRFQ